jgi:hypothetical protein
MRENGSVTWETADPTQNHERPVGAVNNFQDNWGNTTGL